MGLFVRFLVVLYFPLTMAFVCVASLSVYASQSPQVKQCHLTAGFSEWMPYQHFDKSGKPAGLQIELINEIAQRARCTVEYIQLNSAESIDQVRDGHIDFIFSATVTKQRKQYAKFSKSYRNELIVLYVTEKYSKICEEKPLAELIKSGFKLGLQRQSFYGKAVLDIQETPELNQKILYSEDFSSKPNFIRNHQLDGVFDDPIIVSYHLRKEQNKKFLRACGKPISTSPVSIMFSQLTVSDDVVERFNKAIDEVKLTENYRRHWSW